MSEAQTREEYEYEKERKKKRKPVRKKSGFFGKILCLFLGLILGIVATVGGIVGAGYWLYTRPLDKTVSRSISSWTPICTQCCSARRTRTAT